MFNNHLFPFRAAFFCVDLLCPSSPPRSSRGSIDSSTGVWPSKPSRRNPSASSDKMYIAGGRCRTLMCTWQSVACEIQIEKKMRKKGAQSAKCKVLDSSCIILQSTWPHVAKLSHWPESLYAHQSNLVWVLPVLTSPSSWVPLSLQCNQSNYVKVTFRKPEKRILKCGKSKMGQACESNDLPTCLPFKTAWGTFWFEWKSHLNPRVPSQKPKSLFSNFDVQQSQGIPPMTHILKHQKFQLTGIVNTFLCRLQNSVLGILTAPSTAKMQLQKNIVVLTAILLM